MSENTEIEDKNVLPKQVEEQQSSLGTLPENSPLETIIYQAIDAVLQVPKVTGALILSSDGLPIVARGTLNPNTSGSIAQILDYASKQYQGNKPVNPTVTVETGSRSIFAFHTRGRYHLALQFSG